MMKYCKAKKFQGRMSHRGSGKSEGEKRMGNMTQQLTAKMYPHKQSRDGNGGK